MPRVASRTMDSFCVQDKLSTGLFDSKILGPTNVLPGNYFSKFFCDIACNFIFCHTSIHFALSTVASFCLWVIKYAWFFQKNYSKDDS